MEPSINQKESHTGPPVLLNSDRNFGKLIYSEIVIQKSSIVKTRIGFLIMSIILFVASVAIFVSALKAEFLFVIYLCFGFLVTLITGLFLIIFAFNERALEVYEKGIIFPSQPWYEFVRKKNPFIPYNLIKEIIWMKRDSRNIIHVYRFDRSDYQTFGDYNIANIQKFIKSCDGYISIKFQN